MFVINVAIVCWFYLANFMSINSAMFVDMMYL